jgi:hypothetical protein
MDEVEHRRRRTRAGRSHDDTTARETPARPAGVTPADVAERAATAIESVTVEAPVVRTYAEPAQRPSRTRSDGHHNDRHHNDRHPGERQLPFDAHTAHPINEERDGERGLRGLVGSGATQVSVGAAMRARDAARPTEADIAEAEAHLTIVHRGWVPRDPA